MEHVWSATSKAGKIYIGDPCYVMKDAVYHGVWGDQHNFDNGEFDHDGVKFAIGGTAYGDGNYPGSNGTSFPVDAGVIGAVPSELFDEEKVAGYEGRTFPGIMVDADEVILEYDDEGRFDFKTAKGASIAFIDTVGEEDDYYEDEDYYEEDLDESAKRFTAGFRAGLREAIPGVSYWLAKKDRYDVNYSVCVSKKGVTVGYFHEVIGWAGNAKGISLYIFDAPEDVGQEDLWPVTYHDSMPILTPSSKQFIEDVLSGKNEKALRAWNQAYYPEKKGLPQVWEATPLQEARAPKMKWYLMERDNPQLGTYWVKKGPFTRADAPGKSKSVYGGSTYHVFDTEEEYDAKIAELKASGERVRDF